MQLGGGLTDEGVKTLRTSIGEMLNGGILPEGEFDPPGGGKRKPAVEPENPRGAGLQGTAQLAQVRSGRLTPPNYKDYLNETLQGSPQHAGSL